MDRIDEHDGPTAARRSGLSPDAFARITRRPRGADASTGVTWARSRADAARTRAWRRAVGISPMTWTRDRIPVAVEA
jgi:AraC-like DNA-binding protein